MLPGGWDRHFRRRSQSWLHSTSRNSGTSRRSTITIRSFPLRRRTRTLSSLRSSATRNCGLRPEIVGCDQFLDPQVRHDGRRKAHQRPHYSLRAGLHLRQESPQVVTICWQVLERTRGRPVFTGKRVQACGRSGRGGARFTSFILVCLAILLSFGSGKTAKGFQQQAGIVISPGRW
jgi:hypothetical protein